MSLLIKKKTKEMSIGLKSERFDNIFEICIVYSFRFDSLRFMLHIHKNLLLTYIGYISLLFLLIIHNCTYFIKFPSIDITKQKKSILKNLSYAIHYLMICLFQIIVWSDFHYPTLSKICSQIWLR